MNSALNLHALGSCSFVLQLLVFVLHILKSLSSSLLGSSLPMKLKGFAGPLTPRKQSDSISPAYRFWYCYFHQPGLHRTQRRKWPSQIPPPAYQFQLTPLWERTVFNVHSLSATQPHIYLQSLVPRVDIPDTYMWSYAIFQRRSWPC